MADTFVSFLLLDPVGGPLASATPSFVTYVSYAGSPLTAPTIVNLGDGLFGFTIPEASVEADRPCYLVDGTEDAEPRYFAGHAGEVVAFALFDELGEPTEGETVTVEAYKDFAGTDKGGPSVVDLGDGLYRFTPDEDALSEGRVYALSTTAFPEYIHGQVLRTVEVDAPPPAIPIPVPASGYTFLSQLADGTTTEADLGTDVSTFPDLDGTFELLSTRRVLSEALFRRLLTPTGTLPFHPDYGQDIRAFLSEGGTDDSLFRLRTLAEQQCLLDERVAAATATAAFDQTSEALTLTLDIESAAGPFALTIAVTDLTATMLAEE